MAVTQLKDGRWICYYRRRDPDGKSRLKKEYFGRGGEARAAAHERDGELGLKKRRPRKAVAGLIFADLAIAYSRAKNFNPNSRRHLTIRLEANLLPVFGETVAVRIKDADVDGYVARRRVHSIKDSTIARELADLKAILNWAVNRNPPLIPYNPIAGYRSPGQDNDIILPPTQKEIAAILAEASDHLVRAVLLSWYLGLRPGAVELLKLSWIDVDWESKTVLVRSADKGGPRSRRVPIHDEFIRQLKKWYRADQKKGPIVHYHGRPIKSILRGWKGALQRAGITRRIRPYDLRHNFITQALEQGADLKSLSEVVGSSPKTLMRFYQHVTSEMQRKTIAKITPIAPPEPKKKK